VLGVVCIGAFTGLVGKVFLLSQLSTSFFGDFGERQFLVKPDSYYFTSYTIPVLRKRLDLDYFSLKKK
jgi:hypothetical protein